MVDDMMIIMRPASVTRLGASHMGRNVTAFCHQTWKYGSKIVFPSLEYL